MTTDPFPDDSWDELTRELGVEKSPAPSPINDPTPAHNPADPALMDDEQSGDDGEFDGDLGDDAEGDAPDGSDAAAGDEQPGTGRKRRRRRRRRKKGPGEGETEPVAAEEPEEPAAAAPRPVRAITPARPPREEPEFAENDYESEAFSEEPVGLPLAAEEDTAGEVLRDLIANWNVPSWDAIITGLNR